MTLSTPLSFRVAQKMGLAIGLNQRFADRHRLANRDHHRDLGAQLAPGFLAAIIWPAFVGSIILGWQPRDEKCWDGSIMRKPGIP